MKKKNVSKKSAVKLDLGKIEIDVLNDAMLNSIHGGYLSQYRDAATRCATLNAGCTTFPPQSCVCYTAWTLPC